MIGIWSLIDMFRTSQSTKHWIGLGDKLASQGWKRLTREEKKSVVSNLEEVGPFIKPEQLKALCHILECKIPDVQPRNTGKRQLSEKIKASTIAKRIRTAHIMNLELEACLDITI